MKVITVIYGSGHEGNTHACVQELKKVLDRLEREPIEYREFFMPRDMAQPCLGCLQCFNAGSERCPHAAQVTPISEAISEADGVVFASPVYALDVTSGIKCLFDHLCYRWIVHRPDPRMFHKPGLCVTTTLGRGAGRARRTMERNMRFLGMARWHGAGFEMGMPSWAEAGAAKRRRMGERMAREARWLHARMQKPGALKPDIMTRAIMTFVQRFVHARYGDGLDAQYWERQGWHGGRLPF